MKNTIAAVSLAFIIVLSGLTTCGSKEKTDNPVPKTEAAGPAVTHIGTGNFSLEWVRTESNITFTLKGKSTGWIALMVDPKNKMKDGDIYIGYVKDGKAYMQDEFGVQPWKHQPDTELGGKDQILSCEGTEKDGFTEIKFVVDLTSRDQFDSTFGPGDHHLVFAAGPDDSFTSKHNQLAMIGTRFQ
ncbi:MAG: hypothetical protein A2014_03990 [Spirochaetes bacterium GWF1_49_6]|nr:MAG: hypothetical protein A2014_03990 [Spirochaetes bacterium GWF1_49_6]